MNVLKSAFLEIKKNFLMKRNRQMVLIVVAFSLLFFGILSMHFVPGRNSWEVGQVATQDVESDRYLNFVDEAATLALQQQALESFEDVYKVNLDRFNSGTITEISDIFVVVQNAAEAVRTAAELDESENQEAAQEELNEEAATMSSTFSFGMSLDEWKSILQCSDKELLSLYNTITDNAILVMSQGVLQEDLNNARQRLITLIQNDRSVTGAKEKLALGVLHKVALYPSYVVDNDATAAKKAEILAKVEPQKIVVQRGELVVRKGEVLTEQQGMILRQLGYSQSKGPGWILLGEAIIIALLMLVGRAFMMFFTPKLYHETKNIVLILLLIAATMITFDLFLSLSLSSVTARAEQVGCLIPVAMGTMLITILLDLRLGILADAIFAAFVGLYTGSVGFSAVALIGGLTGALGVADLEQRSDIFRAAMGVSIANMISILAVGMLQAKTADVVLIGVVYGLFNGLLSSIFTMGLLPYLETMFGITTSVKLLELANPSNPLLKQLMVEAPGTYHHCIMVGNLGEAAADAIGANGLLVRLGAYYHDIGKLKRPYFFSENQLSGVNPHDNITPQLSTLIITSHVKDGIEMAKEAKLPPVIISMIAQHHGDSTVGYFYFKAKEANPDIKESDYRYGQPKPQTKEAAILMMADTVEAAVRSKKDATPGQIEGFIRTLIKQKLNDGQFDECDLTFRDLDQVASAFARVTNGLYHKRIEYPAQLTEMVASRAKQEKEANDLREKAKKDAAEKEAAEAAKTTEKTEAPKEQATDVAENSGAVTDNAGNGSGTAGEKEKE